MNRDEHRWAGWAGKGGNAGKVSGLSSLCSWCLRGENSGEVHHKDTKDIEKAVKVKAVPGTRWLRFARHDACFPVIAKARSA